MSIYGIRGYSSSRESLEFQKHKKSGKKACFSNTVFGRGCYPKNDKTLIFLVSMVKFAHAKKENIY